MADDKVDIFLPLFVGDYLAGTTDLTLEEHGAYLLLLMDAWKRSGRLPVDRTRLAMIVKVDPDRFIKIWDGIGRFFTDHGTYLTQKRLSAVLEKAKEKKVKAVERAKVAAGRRWDDKPQDAPSIAPSNAPGTASSTASSMPQAMLEQCPLSLSSERKRSEAPAASPPTEIPVMLFPTKDGGEWPLYPSKVEQWKRSYPNVNVMAQLQRAWQWTMDNGPKTGRGMTSFLGRWLATESQRRETRQGSLLGAPQGGEDPLAEFRRKAGELADARYASHGQPSSDSAKPV